MVIASLDTYAKTLISSYNDHQLWSKFHTTAVSFVDTHFSMGRLTRYTEELTSNILALNLQSSSGSLNTGKLNVVWDIMNRDSSSLSSIYSAFPYLSSSNMNNIITQNGCPPNAINIDVFIRIKRLPSLSRPICCPVSTCVFIVYLSWDWGHLPTYLLDAIDNHVDFVWALTSYHATMFKDSGVAASIVRKVPYGIDCNVLATTLVKTDLRQELGISSTTTVFAYIGFMTR